MSKDKESIQVTIRVRPLSDKQKFEDPRICVSVEEGTQSLQTFFGTENRKFTFDSICNNKNQEQIFEQVGKKSTGYCLEGYNCTIFAYGQTGSGKTFTMMGVDPAHQQYQELRGLIPRTLQYMFESIDSEIKQKSAEYLIKCSFLQIYNEQIIDLLNKNNGNLQIREDIKKGVYVQGITEESIERGEEALQILKKGSKGRHVGSTCYNEASSRSHSVFTMQIQSKINNGGIMNTKVRYFHFIDLAGSERTKQINGERLKQGCSINKSLHVLGKVINSLAQSTDSKARHVNYRDSKLTFLLKDSLGGNSKTHLIANISPCMMSYVESNTTLAFARRVKLIKVNKVSINEDTIGNLESLKDEIKRLKQEIIFLRNGSSNILALALNSSDAEEVSSTEKYQGQANPKKLMVLLKEQVNEQIEKQTNFQTEFQKLNHQITCLKLGIERYAKNQLHLRNTIMLYQKKFQRVDRKKNKIEKRISQLEPTSKEIEQIVVEYFREERDQLRKQIDIYQKRVELIQSFGQLASMCTSYRKVFKLEGGDNNNLMEKISKNTEFLKEILGTINEFKKQEQVQDESTDASQYLQKIQDLSIESKKRQTQLMQKIQLYLLENQELKQNFEDNEILLRESVDREISLEKQIKQTAQNLAQRDKQVQQKEIIIKQLEKNLEIITQEKTLVANKLSENLLHLGSMQSHIQNLQASLQQLNASSLESLQQKQQRLREQQLKVSHLKDQALRIQSQLKRFQKQLSQQKQSNKAWADKYKVLNGKYTQLGQQKQQKEEQIEVMRIQEQAQKMQIEQKVNKLAHFQQLLKEYEKKQDQIKLQSKQKQCQFLQMISQMQSSSHINHEQINKIKIENIRLKQEKEEGQNKINKLFEKLKESDYQVKEKMSKIQEQQTFVGQLQGKNTLMRQELLEMKNINIEKDYRLQQLKSTVHYSQKKLQQKQDEIIEMADKYQRLSGQINEVRRQLNACKLQVRQKHNELQIKEKSYELDIQSLRKQGEGKVTRFNEEKSSMLLQIKTKERVISELTQQGQAVRLQLAQTKKSIAVIEESFKNDLQKELDKKEVKIREKSGELEKMKERTEQLTNMVEYLEEQIEQERNGKIELLSKIEEIQMEKLELKARGQNLDKQFGAFKQEASQKDVRMKEEAVCAETVKQQLQASLHQTETQKLQLSQAYSSLLHNFEQLKGQNDRVKNELVQQNGIFMAFRQQSLARLKNAEDERQALRLQCKGLFQQIERVTVKKEQCQQAWTEQQVNETGRLQGIIAGLQLSMKKDGQCWGLKQCQFNEKVVNLQAEVQNYRYILENNQKKMDGERIEKEQLVNQLNQSKQLFTITNLKLQTQSVQLRQQQQKLVEFKQILRQKDEELESCRQYQQINQDLDSKVEQLIRNLQEQEDNFRTIQVKYNDQCSANSNLKMFIEKIEEEKNIEMSEINEKKDIYDKQIKILQEQLKCKSQQFQTLRAQFQSVTSRLKQTSSQFDCFQSDNSDLIAQLNEINHTSDQTIRSQVLTIESQQHLIEEQQFKLEQYQKTQRQKQQELKSCRTYQQINKGLGHKIEELISNLQQQKTQFRKLQTKFIGQCNINSNLKQLIENSQQQKKQLTIELADKKAIYEKLLQKINKTQQSSTIKSEHYLKTVQLLEKTRQDQSQHKKANEQLKKSIFSKQQLLTQKQLELKQLKKKTQQYSKSVQNNWTQFSLDHQNLVKQHNLISVKYNELQRISQKLRRQSEQNKVKISRLTLRVQQQQQKNRLINQQYIILQQQNHELKKKFLYPGTIDDKVSNYVNKLKSQNNDLRRQKLIWEQSMKKTAEQKVKLKQQVKYGGKQDTSISTTQGDKNEIVKKNEEIYHLQKVIADIIKLIPVDVEYSEVDDFKIKLKTIGDSLKSGIKQKIKENQILKAKLEQYQLRNQTVYPSGKQNKSISSIIYSGYGSGKKDSGSNTKRQKSYSIKDEQLSNLIKTKINQQFSSQQKRKGLAINYGAGTYADYTDDSQKTMKIKDIIMNSGKIRHQ